MSRNRYHVGLRLNLDDKAKLIEMVKFWGGAQGVMFFDERDLMRLAFDQLYAATKQLILKKEKAGEFDTKTIGGPGSGDTAPAAESVSAGADTAATHEVVRDESTGNIVEQAVSGS